jgi:hypothetical protein
MWLEYPVDGRYCTEMLTRGTWTYSESRFTRAVKAHKQSDMDAHRSLKIPLQRFFVSLFSAAEALSRATTKEWTVRPGEIEKVTFDHTSQFIHPSID